MRQQCLRRGLTLIELLVIIAIVAILAGLLLPAIRSGHGHGHGRRTQCLNNMRQVALGLIQSVNAHNVYPNSGTFEEDPTALASGDPKDSNIYKALSNPAGFGASGPRHSWVVSILPFIDNQDLFDAFNQNTTYSDTSAEPGKPSNAKIGATSIGILTCPDDPTIVDGGGNLSYVVNGGFTRWHADLTGWQVNADGSWGAGPALDWGTATAKQTGLMFLGTSKGDAPWDVRTSANSVSDGAGTTIMLSENLRAGAAPGGVAGLTGTVPTNWACPHPNFVAFLASDNVCNGGGTGLVGTGSCGTASPRTQGGKTFGPHWANANRPGTHENINAGLKVAEKGGSPYPSSHHAGSVNVVMCDGSARFVAEGIDGEVWAKLVTPQGNRLPQPFGQAPLKPGDLDE